MQARAGAGSVRWVRPENRHVTLQFLGDTSAGLVGAIEEAMRGAAHEVGSPLNLAINGMGAFPKARRPRTLWVGVTDTDGELARLERALRRRLLALDFELDERPFRPHITTGYVRKRASSEERHAITRALQHTEVEALSFQVDEITLVQSELAPGGSRYTGLARVSLSGP